MTAAREGKELFFVVELDVPDCAVIAIAAHSWVHRL